MTTNSHDISVLNALIATTLDSMKGYKEACEDSESHHSTFFSGMVEERSRVASQLQSEVATLGGDPEDDSTVMGAVHRGFMKLKEAVTTRDEKAIINEVERGEDYIKEKFDAALKDDELSPSARSAVQVAYSSIKSGHDRVSAMKQAAN